jgi:hypothetical protein
MKRATAWWFLAEGLCERITAPKVDVTAVDREIHALIRESRLWSLGVSVASKVEAAWQESWCRSGLRSLTGNQQ